MGKEKKNLKIESPNDGPKKKVYNSYSRPFVMQVVNDVLSGDLTPTEAAKKYGVPNYMTVKYWVKEFEGEKSKPRQKNARYSADFKRKIVQEIEWGLLTRWAAHKKYNVPDPAIKYWIKQYRQNNEVFTRQLSDSNDDSSSKEIRNEESLVKRIAELEKQLEYKTLKVEALEVMIDVAEEELKIDIKKKHGLNRSLYLKGESLK